MSVTILYCIRLSSTAKKIDLQTKSLLGRNLTVQRQYFGENRITVKYMDELWRGAEPFY